MNNLLQISGRIQSKPNPYPGIPIPKFRNNTTVTIEQVSSFEHSISEILDDYRMFKLTGGALLSIEYEDVIAKSNRMRCLFKQKSTDNMNDYIRGSKFNDVATEKKVHIFTYFFKKAALIASLRRLQRVATILMSFYDGRFNNNDYDELPKKYNSDQMSRSEFSQVMADLSYIRNIGVDRNYKADQDASIISFFSTDVPTKSILESIGLRNVELINDVSAYLRPEDLAKIQAEIPYLVSMKVRDLTCISQMPSTVSAEQKQYFIEEPGNEPIIGVIDTLFEKNVYFHDWVDYKELVPESNQNPLNRDIDTEHGTEISSIIVDGPRLNPWLEDNCGRFRVRHFGVAIGSSYSSFEIIKHIEHIVKSNRDIKVWNFSLGSETESNINFISPEAALLDKLQTENDIIFVVSGTNDNEKTKRKRIGSPADSLNSLVVNSVRKDNSKVSYYRKGPVLSFFRKPDLSYYGGDENEKLTVYGPKGRTKTYGTSFAAAWMTRKVAFLIYKMGFTKELAKALLIDAAANWTSIPDYITGYGVSPKKVSEIIEAKDDEIRFVMTGISKEFETFAYDLPIPINEGKHPFYARATLCYFPPCSRYQGVDYTSTELDIHFGRVVLDKEGRLHIKSLDHNLQGAPGKHYLKEETVREQFRKWDNIKIIRDALRTRSLGKKTYGKGLWGLSLKSKERLFSQKEHNIPFSIVVTLKEVNGKNRNNEFIKLCSYYGWIVEQIDINNRLEIFNQASEEITLY